MDYINNIGFDTILEHENDLTKTILKRLNTFPNITIVGNPKNRSGIISFNIRGIHPMDVGILLGQKNICVRTGFHCNEPLMTHLKLDGTIRLSIALYNNYKDIDLFFEKLTWVQDLLSRKK
jgi:cysteine desulfurase/selenocysteine lyase